MASTLKRWPPGPVSPIFSMASIPALTTGDRPRPPRPWKTSTRTFAPPGGDGSGQRCRAGGSGSGARVRGAAPTAVRRRRPSAATRGRPGPSSGSRPAVSTLVSAWAPLLRSQQQPPRKLDPFARLANSYDRNATNFVLSVDKRGVSRLPCAVHRGTRSAISVARVGSSAWTDGSFNRRLLAVARRGRRRHRCLSPPPAAAQRSADAARRRPPRPAARSRHIKLYAEKLPDGQMGYGLEKGKATVPGPLIEINEGDTLHIEFENTMDVAASLHVHGLDYDIASDGTKLNKSHVEPGGTRTYTWRTHAPGTPRGRHLAAGQRGLLALPRPRRSAPTTARAASARGSTARWSCAARATSCRTRQFTIVFNDMMINNKPRTPSPNFEATVGDRVEIVDDHARRVLPHLPYARSSLGGQPHRPADRPGRPQPGHRQQDHRARPTPSASRSSRGRTSGAGAWMYHCHVQSHSDMGMAGLFLVAKPDGTIPGYEPHHPAAGAGQGGS